MSLWVRPNENDTMTTERDAQKRKNDIHTKLDRNEVLDHVGTTKWAKTAKTTESDVK